MYGFRLSAQHETMAGGVMTIDQSVTNGVWPFDKVFEILKTVLEPADTGQSQRRVDAGLEHCIAQCHLDVGLACEPSGTHYIAHMTVDIQYVAGTRFEQPFLAREIEILA